MSSPRPVRIARSSGSGPSPPSPVAASSRENLAGRQRATRWFLVFAIGLAVLYGAFLVLEAGAAGGLSASPLSILLFSALALGFLIWGWSITLHRAPLRIEWSAGEIVVVESRRRTRRYLIGPAFERVVVTRYPANAFLPDPTELVRVGDAGGFHRHYLVTKGLFEPEPVAE